MSLQGTSEEGRGVTDGVIHLSPSADVNIGGTDDRAIRSVDGGFFLSHDRLGEFIGQQVKAEVERLSGHSLGSTAPGSCGMQVGEVGVDGAARTGVRRRTHTLSESSTGDSDGGFALGPVAPDLTAPAERDDDFDAAVTGLTDLIAPSVQPSASGLGKPEGVVDLLAQDWGLIYNDEEKFGPPVNEELAKLVNKFIRARPNEEQLRLATADVLVPENTQMLTVPLLNKEFEGIFSYKHGVYMERQICRQIGLACKALGPMIRLLDGWHRCQASTVSRDEVKGVSDSVRLLISMINLQNFARKQNVLSCVRDPNLKSLCTWDTQVEEKTLFPANVADLLAELKKKYKVGPAGYQQGSYRGTKRLKRDYVYNSHRGSSRGGSRGRSSRGRSSGGSQDQKDESSFLWRGPRGRGRRP